MTVTKRKNRETGGDAAVPVLESGMKASCDSCSADITHNVHVRCAETKDVNGMQSLTCSDFDLCVPCFLSGKQVGPHRATHAYRIISSHSFPIFTPDWGADEELLLIEGAELYGLGNWADMAEHVGGRTKEECEEHYLTTYIQSPDYPLPVTDLDFGIDQEIFQKRKKTRLEDLQSRPLLPPPPKPLASAPTCHEVAGFMPGRLEFETEYENEAETLIKDIEFGRVYRFGGDEQPDPPKPPSTVKPEGATTDRSEGGGGGGDDEIVITHGTPDEDEEELQLKLAVMEMFNEKYDKRVAAKDLIFDRGLMNYKTLVADERKRTKEERDLVLRTKVFARIQTAQDHETFVDGLLYEITLRKKIADLQEYRRNGVTTLAEGERYDHAKAQRASSKAASYRDSIMASYDRGANRQNRPSLPMDRKVSASPRPSTGALTLANSASLHLLTVLEQQLCSTLRVLPRPYLFLKEALLREWVRTAGKMGARDARKVVLRDPAGVNFGLGAPGEWGEKVERVFEFLVESGGLRRPREEGASLPMSLETSQVGSTAGLSLPMSANNTTEGVGALALSNAMQGIVSGGEV